MLATVEMISKEMQAKNFKFDRCEFAGAFGDIGVLFPLSAALITINGMNPSVIFLFAGMLYLAAGIYFRVPVPVQPLKAVAIIAIAMKLSPIQISASGLLIGIILLILAFTGIIGTLNKILSKAVIRGIQLGIGLLLMKSGFKMIVQPFEYSYLFLGIAGIFMIFLFRNKRTIPSVAALILFGFIFALIFKKFGDGNFTFGMEKSVFKLPGLNDISSAFFLLVIPQLPLTLGNAIIASADASKLYFKDRANRVSEKRLAVSLGISNTIIGICGGLPLCHGAGGVTAHYKFGARTAGANIIIGSTLIIVALLFGKAFVNLFNYFPIPLLGSMLIYVGFEHSKLIKSLFPNKEFIVVSLTIGIISFFTKNILIACLVGIGEEILFRIIRKIRTKFFPIKLKD
ncbi:putative sulfate/molybdate transporter [candidate division KSB1 bacterium]